MFANELTKRERARGAALSEVYTLNKATSTVTIDSSANGYRLPTEAEWEYAAKGGSAQMYSGTDDLRTLCKFGNIKSVHGPNSSEADPCKVVFDGPAPVGSLLPNPFGIYDMLGNVREWVYDWYGSYSRTSAGGPTESSSGGKRVLRDGDWSKSATEARTSARTKAYPSYENFTIGFRLARTDHFAPPTPKQTGSPHGSGGSK